MSLVINELSIPMLEGMYWGALYCAASSVNIPRKLDIGGSVFAVTLIYAILAELVATGPYATKTSLGEVIDALAVASTETGGPSGRSIVDAENSGEHHLAFVLLPSVTSPPEVFVDCVWLWVLVVN